MNEQAGLIYHIHPDNVAAPNTTEGKRLFQSTIDDLFYFKLSDGTLESYNPFAFIPQYKGQTTDGTLTELFVSAVPNSRIQIQENTSGAFIFFFVARDINNEDTGYFFNYVVTFKDVNGITTLTGASGQVNLDTGDPATFSWTAGFDVVNGNKLRFQVQGEVGKTINWATSQIRLTQVEG